MALKKGQKIWAVYINDGRVSAISKSADEIKLTRSQRNALMDYENPNYIENIQKEFCNKGCLHEGFSVMKDGNVVFEL